MLDLPQVILSKSAKILTLGCISVPGSETQEVEIFVT